jgi:benzoylformate decarboxylase
MCSVTINGRMAGSQSEEDSMNRSTGCFQFLRQLQAEGIHCLFGNPGTSEQNLLSALSDPEFKDFTYYLSLQEGSAVAMGDAYARATRRPAAVQLHSYAGLANGLGMIKYAHRGCTPMVVFAGEAGLKYDALDGQMAGDLTTMARPFVKADNNGPCAWRVVDPGSVLRLLRRALKSAATPPAGPVFLSLPMDVLDAVNEEPVVRATQVSTQVAPPLDIIHSAAEILAGAKAPMLLVGDGIAASNAQAELTKVAELLGATVVGGNYSEVNMRASHPLFRTYGGHMFGADSQTYLSKADAVLICGTTVLPEVFPLLENVFDPKARLIHFDLNATEIGKNFPVEIGAVADPKVALSLLIAELPANLVASAARRTREWHDKKTAAEHAARANDQLRRDEVPLHAFRFMQDLAARFDNRECAIFDEALTHTPELLRYLPQDRPGCYFQTRAGMLGTGLPGALGLKVAFPDKLVLGFCGDGGAMQTIQALSTAARHRLGVKFVICNNHSYRILKYNLQAYWRDLDQPVNEAFPACFDLDPPTLRFDLLAQGQGVPAVRVEKPEQIQPALDQALQDDEPFLIDLVLSSSL